MVTIEEERIRAMAKQPSGPISGLAKPPLAPAKQAPTQATQPGIIQRAFPNTSGAMADRRTQIDAAQQAGGYGAAFGQSARTIMNPAIGLVDDSAQLAQKALNPAAQALKTFVTGDASPIGSEPMAPPVAPVSKLNPSIVATAPKPAMQSPISSGPISQLAAKPAPMTQPTAQPSATEVKPGVFRIGNSFSDSAAGATAGAKAAPISAQNMAAADALAARYQSPISQMAQAPQQPASQNFTPPESAGGTGYGLLNSNRIAQRNAMMDVQQLKPGSGKALSALLQQQADAPNQQIARDRLAQGAQESAADRMARREEFGAKLGESAADRALRSQELADNSLTNQVKRDAMGVESGAAKQMAALRSQYLDAKTPEEAAAAAAKINALSGKGTQQDEYMAVSSGQSVDPATGMVTKSPDIIVNKRTGQPVSGQQAKPAAALPAGMTRQVGTSGGKPVYEDASGKRFLGG